MSFSKLTRNERKGFVGLLLLLFVILTYKFYSFEVLNVSIEKAALEIEKTNKSQPQTELKKSNQPATSIAYEDRVDPLNVKQFNPNLNSIEDWKLIGFPEKMSETIYKYIKLKSGIHQPKDLLAIYGFKKVWLEQIKDSMEFSIPLMDIQTALPKELKSLKGIGEVLSGRIFKYRNSLGGFNSINQLKEVYGVDSVLFESIQHRLRLSPSNLNKIDLMNSSLQDLSKHPYITKDEAFKLISIRSEKGKIENTDLIDVFGLKKIEKLKHYINE